MPERQPRPVQQGLFGSLDDLRPAQRADDSVAPAVPAEELRRLGAQLPPTLRLGTSSWNFPGWRGLVYAADAPQKHLSRRGLAAYAQHPLLRTVGVDHTFYAPATAATFADYAAQVPADFRFLVKTFGELLQPRLPRQKAPNPRYLDADAFVVECLEPAQQGLGDKLGVMLLQFSPQGRELVREPRLFTDLLHAFLRRLPKGAPYAVELRDAALLNEEHVAALRDCGAAHAFVVHPSMPPLARQRELVPITADGGPVVLRWMLHAGFAYEQAKERYEPFDRLVDVAPDSRATIAAMAHDALRCSVPMTVVVNNKAEGSSPLSVLELVKAIVAAGPG
ncbi:MAG: DUF72 domain-containing protein [Planctomycetota bacterium]